MEACVLCGAECWIPLKKHIRKLNTFYHRCLRVFGSQPDSSGVRGLHQLPSEEDGEMENGVVR